MLRRTILALLAAATLLGAASPASAAPDPSPPGANDWGCRPTAAHPEPVVLLHGLSATMGVNWSALSPKLRARGLCVFALTYGRDPRYVNPVYEPGGVVAIERSSLEIQAFVRRVLEVTGAREVDVVGHSEGTVQAGYLVRQPGFAELVDDVVALTPLWRGTNVAGVGMLYAMGKPFGLSQAAARLVGALCGSCAQFVAGSEFMERLAQGGVAVEGVSYTNLVTRYDQLVVPYTSGVMGGPDVRNVVLQQVCGLDFSEHAWMAFSPIVHQLVLNALDPARARPPACRLVLPGLP